jgi:hypothetical protein
MTRAEIEDSLRNDYELNEEQIKAVFDIILHYHDVSVRHKRMIKKDACCSQFDPCTKHGG